MISGGRDVTERNDGELELGCCHTSSSVLDQACESRIETEETTIRACGEDVVRRCEGARATEGAGSSHRDVSVSVDAAEADTGEVVHTARRERACLDALARWVVVDRLARSVGRGRSVVAEVRTCEAAHVATVGVIQVEQETRGKAHRLDRDELVRHEAAEDATDDGERDVREAADVAVASGGGAAT